VPANEFLNLEGRKLSTSRGWAVWVDEFLSHFEADLIRYGLGTIMPENKDADFSWKEFQQRINSELADILGNFIYRTTSFTSRFFDGKVPSIQQLDEPSQQVLNEIDVQKKRIEEAYRTFSFKEAIAESLQLARIGNKYFTDREPWKTSKTDPEHCAVTLYTGLQLCAALSLIFDPIMPHKMAQLRKQLGLNQHSWDQISPTLLPPQHPIEAGEILFAKIEDDKIQARIDALLAKSQAMEASSPSTDVEHPYAAAKPEISIDDFAKIDLRIGTVLEAEAVKSSKKLLKLKVDLGYEQRTILSGIATVVSPEQLLGKKVVVVANLKPRPMMGTESHGMILMSEDRTGRLVMVSSENEAGSTVS